jgi:hypothetical protein
MKRTVLSGMLCLLLTAAIPTYTMASVKHGKRVYKKRMYKKCGFSGVKFARHHTQAEWETIYEKGSFAHEAKSICPKLDTTRIRPKEWQELYEFSLKYAKDGVAPNGCND